MKTPRKGRVPSRSGLSYFSFLIVWHIAHNPKKTAAAAVHAAVLLWVKVLTVTLVATADIATR